MMGPIIRREAMIVINWEDPEPCVVSAFSSLG